MSFSRQPNPVWLFTDLEGNILDDNYYISFLENTIPYLPQPVFQDDQGLVPWANPLQFHPDGTLPDNMYWEDGLVWRLEIRRGPTQADPLIRLIENFVAEDNEGPSTTSLTLDNQITNPQFALISFNSPYVITNTGNNSYEIAPGWVLDLESTGSAVLTLNRVAIAGNENLPIGSPTNPSYALSFEVTSGSFTSIKLRQRFDHAPAIWASEGISVSLTGKVLNNSAPITVDYIPSNGTSTTILNDTLSSVYQFLSGGVQLPASDSTDTGDNGYVDIVFTLPIIGTTFLTNIQIIGSAQAAGFPYAQTTVERQIDQTFHYYADSILYQPKSTLLTGWNFGLNPWQFRTTTISNLANNAYTADQTIVIQQPYVAAATANNVQVGRGTAAQNYAFIVRAALTPNKFALMQYIDPATIRPYWGKNLSCMVTAQLLSPTHSSAIRIKAKLLYKAGLPGTIAQADPIATWDNAANTFTYAAGWTALTPLNDPTYTLSADNTSFSFDHFTLPASSSDDMTLALMIYTMDSMDPTATADEIRFQRISLVQNDFAIDVPPETFDEALAKCQFYYEKSYSNGVLPGAVAAEGSRIAAALPVVNGLNTDFVVRSFGFAFNTLKRSTAPTITLYSPSGPTAARVQGNILNNSSTPVSIADVQLAGIWTQSWLNSKAVTYISATTSAPFQWTSTSARAEAYILYQFTADARLGI